jgi:sulfur carrier protein ThiS
MPLAVRMPDILAERSIEGQMRLSMPYRDGMKARDVVAKAGFSGEEAEAILIVVNGSQVTGDDVLTDGDTVELVIQMVGG